MLMCSFESFSKFIPGIDLPHVFFLGRFKARSTEIHIKIRHRSVSVFHYLDNIDIYLDNMVCNLDILHSKIQLVSVSFKRTGKPNSSHVNIHLNI